MGDEIAGDISMLTITIRMIRSRGDYVYINLVIYKYINIYYLSRVRDTHTPHRLILLLPAYIYIYIYIDIRYINIDDIYIIYYLAFSVFRRKFCHAVLDSREDQGLPPD